MFSYQSKHPGAFFQMLMSAIMEAITVMLTQSVLIQMGVLTAHVMQDTGVMASAAMVNTLIFQVKTR